VPKVQSWRRPDRSHHLGSRTNRGDGVGPQRYRGTLQAPAAGSSPVDHLRHVSVGRRIDECVLRIELDSGYRAARLLGRHAQQEVLPEEMQIFPAEKLPEMCAWAVEHETWGPMIRESADVVEGLSEHYANIHRGYLESTETE
jgi:hypothetical protein